MRGLGPMKIQKIEALLVLISIASTVIGLTVWLANVAFKTDANGRVIEKLEIKQLVLDGIQNDLTLLKYKLEQIDKKLGDIKNGTH